MDSEKIIVWSLRLITFAIILIPLAFYYFTSESPLSFLAPRINFPSNLMSFNPNSLHITSVNYNITGNTYLLNIELLNAGSMKIGLKEFDAMIVIDSLNIRGRLILQFPFVLEQGEKETIKVNLFLESGTHKDLSKIFSQNIPMNLSGKTVLILNSAEVPLDFTITIGIPW